LHCPKKPYEKYKDIKLAIKLIEKGLNPIFQDEESPASSPINHYNDRFDTKRGHGNFKVSRLKVHMKDANHLKYRNYIGRSRTIDQLGLFR
jgi:hypothetical protein